MKMKTADVGQTQSRGSHLGCFYVTAIRRFNFCKFEFLDSGPVDFIWMTLVLVSIRISQCVNLSELKVKFN